MGFQLESSATAVIHASHGGQAVPMTLHGRRAGGRLYLKVMSKRRRKKAKSEQEAPEAAETEVAVAEGETSDPHAEPPSEEVSADSEAAPEHADESSSDAPSEQPAASESREPEPFSGELSPEQVIEAVLFSSDTPLPLAKLTSILGVGSARDVRNHIESLNRKYEQSHASFRIENIAGGYQMLTLPAFNTWVRKLKQSRQDSRLSAAALETLAIVAYKQPVVRADVEALRGVASGEMLNRLRELGLVKIVGRAEDVGRPMLYGTTKRFLEVFGLSSLEELPEVEELQSPHG